MLNNAIFMGRFTADPELRHTAAGTPCCGFSLAVERDGKPDENGHRYTDFIDCVSWRGTAEFIARNFIKGQRAVCRGKMQTRTWIDNLEQRRKTTELYVENIYFADSKKENTEGEFTASHDIDEGLPF